MYKEVDDLKTWKDIRNFLNNFSIDWVFRGQQRYEWGLQTGIDRVVLGPLENSPPAKQNLENAMLQKLERHIHNIPPQQAAVLTSGVQKIAFLQHFGAPTRLLDFSISPYVAMFFAIENATEDCSLFAINHVDLRSRNSEMSYLVDAERNISRRLLPQNISDPKKFDRVLLGYHQIKFVALIDPYYKFDRLITQSGCFLCQGDVNTCFEDNLRNTISMEVREPKPVFKIKIPINQRLDILAELKRKMNIDRSTLFPGVEGFIRSLSLAAFLDLV